MATKMHAWGGDETATAAGAKAGTDYKAIIANLAQSLMPGGSVEKSYVADAVQEGRQLSAQLNAASISKGLGNATSSAPVTAMKHIAKRKTEIRSGLLQQLLPLLQNLMSMQQQQSQFETSQAQEYELNRRPTNAERGLDAFGQPMSNFGFGSNPTAPSFSAPRYPSLAAAGGMTPRTGGTKVPSLFGDSSGSSGGDGVAPGSSFTGYARSEGGGLTGIDTSKYQPGARVERW